MLVAPELLVTQGLVRPQAVTIQFYLLHLLVLLLEILLLWVVEVAAHLYHQAQGVLAVPEVVVVQLPTLEHPVLQGKVMQAVVLVQIT